MKELMGERSTLVEPKKGKTKELDHEYSMLIRRVEDVGLIYFWGMKKVHHFWSAVIPGRLSDTKVGHPRPAGKADARWYSSRSRTGPIGVNQPSPQGRGTVEVLGSTMRDRASEPSSRVALVQDEPRFLVGVSRGSLTGVARG